VDVVAPTGEEREHRHDEEQHGRKAHPACPPHERGVEQPHSRLVRLPGTAAPAPALLSEPPAARPDTTLAITIAVAPALGGALDAPAAPPVELAGVGVR